MPIITMCAWTSLALLSAWLRLVRRSSSKPETPREPRRRGSTLISRLNWASSVWKCGLAIASSASALFSDGRALVVDEVELDLHARSSGSRCRSGTRAASARRRRGSGVPSPGSRVRSERGELLQVDFVAHAGTLVAETAPVTRLDARRP